MNKKFLLSFILTAGGISYAHEVRAEYCRDGETTLNGQTATITECYADKNDLTNPISKSGNYKDIDGWDIKFTETYNSSGKLTSSSNTVIETDNNNETYTYNYKYEYDADNRLSNRYYTVIDEDAGKETWNTSTSYSYDENGNLNQVISNNSVNDRYVYTLGDNGKWIEKVYYRDNLMNTYYSSPYFDIFIESSEYDGASLNFGDFYSVVDNTPVTSYTVATATKRVEDIGGCEEVKCSLKMWFK